MHGRFDFQVEYNKKKDMDGEGRIKEGNYG
jgi:hypothetical protein